MALRTAAFRKSWDPDVLFIFTARNELPEEGVGFRV